MNKVSKVLVISSGPIIIDKRWDFVTTLGRQTNENAARRGVIEGACGPRPGGKPIPQTKDSLLWRATLSKVKDEDEKIVINVEPLLPEGQLGKCRRHE